MKKEIREKIYNKFVGHCAYCGDLLQKGWHVDELLPIKRYWKYKKDGNGSFLRNSKNNYIKEHFMEHPERLTFDNQMPSCPSCNINKHSLSLEDFRGLISGFIKSMNRDSVQYKVAKRYGLLQETEKPVVFYFEKQ